MKTRLWSIAISLAVSLTAAAQQADIRNAQIDTRDASIERTVASLGTAADPVWVGWRVPMVSGLRDLCGTWSDGSTTVRTAMLEGGGPLTSPPATGAAGPRVANLEAGTTLLVWIRVVGGNVERLRMVTDDCPVDAGTRRVVELSGSRATESVAFLDRLLTPPPIRADAHHRLSIAVLGALALHASPSADGVLKRYVTPDANDQLRMTAATWIGSARGSSGFAFLVDLLRSSDDANVRRAAVAGIVASRQPETLGTLWRIAETDVDEVIRAEALGGLAELAPEADMARLTTRVAAESSDRVKVRAMRGLSRRPAASSVPLLVSLARSSTDKVLRVEAVRALSRSSHPDAVTYLTEILK
jgi:hypothetical protein